MENQLTYHEARGCISVLSGIILVLEACEAVIWGEEVALLEDKEVLDKKSALLHQEVRETIRYIRTLFAYLGMLKAMLMIMNDPGAPEEEKKKVDSYDWMAILKIVFKFSQELSLQWARLDNRKAGFNYTALRQLQEDCKAFIEAITKTRREL